MPPPNPNDLTVIHIVFNLYPFQEGCYLPSAYLVQEDRSGLLTHIVQRATALTANSHQIQLGDSHKRLLDLIELLTPKALEARFKAPKAKTATPLDKLLTEKETKGPVEAYIHRQLDLFLSEIQRCKYHITLDAERKTLVKDVLLAQLDAPLIPWLSFDKTPEGITYRLQLGTETERWQISSRDVTPLTNTDPAWIIADYALFRVPGINGNMVKPFRQKNEVLIPKDKEKMYFRQFIAKSIRRSRVEANGFRVVENNTLRKTRLEAVEHFLEKNWRLKTTFEYDGAEFAWGERRDRITSIDIPENDHEEISVHLILRDQSGEQQNIELLGQLGAREEDRLFSVAADYSLDALLEWLGVHRKTLEQAGFLLVSPEVEGKKLSLLPAQINVRSEAAGDWFDVHGEVEIGAQRYPFKDFVPYLKQNIRFFPLSDGSFFYIPEAWFSKYSDLAMALREEDDSLRLPKTLYTVLQDGATETDADAFPIIDPDSIDYLPASDLQAELRPYQLRGVRWLVGHFRHGFGACLADDMGLGKTLQTIAFMLYVKGQQGRRDAAVAASDSALQLNLFQAYTEEIKPLQALIILPASLVFNWQRELQRFAPSLYVYIHTGPKRLKDLRAVAAHDVVLTTYHTARQDLDLLQKQVWQIIILDESQQIKNRESELSKVVRSLDARHKVSLSGTPIENSLSDLWSQMEFINPETLGSFKLFREQFMLPIERQGDSAAREKLFTRVRPFFLRRTKEEVAPDLPELSEQIFYTEMTAEQQKRYESVKSAVRNQILSLFDEPKTRLQALQALMRLRQLACHPALADKDYQGSSGKFEDVLAQWDTIRRAGHKVLFFSSFEQHLQHFRRQFEAEGVPYAWLTGDTPPAERSLAVEAFQQDPKVQAFFMTIKAGGVGLNLTAADYVFLLDPWWNPAAEAQAIARAHRIGQENPVTAIRFISRATIEEKILVLQARKRQLGEGLFSDNETPQLTRADMEELLG